VIVALPRLCGAHAQQISSSREIRAARRSPRPRGRPCAAPTVASPQSVPKQSTLGRTTSATKPFGFGHLVCHERVHGGAVRQSWILTLHLFHGCPVLLISFIHCPRICFCLGSSLHHGLKLLHACFVSHGEVDSCGRLAYSVSRARMFVCVIYQMDAQPSGAGGRCYARRPPAAGASTYLNRCHSTRPAAIAATPTKTVTRFLARRDVEMGTTDAVLGEGTYRAGRPW